ncbi:MAG: hypothetical protein LBC72_03885 [Spirochaetaceae bacterium]|nr:hypothetical protein [Spirochaetaceae bacterium]
MKIRLLCLTFVVAAAFRAAAQEAPPAQTAALPRTFRGMSLGMDIDALKTALTQDTSLAFRGDSDVSLLPLRRQLVIDTEGYGFIKRAFFQVEDTSAPGAPSPAESPSAASTGGVFIMAFVLNTAKIDHYSVFTSFMEKYGEPVVLNPRMAIWEDGATRVFIERPLTVKYIDKAVFEKIAESAKARESAGTVLREQFLDEF